MAHSFSIQLSPMMVQDGAGTTWRSPADEGMDVRCVGCMAGLDSTCRMRLRCERGIGDAYINNHAHSLCHSAVREWMSGLMAPLRSGHSIGIPPMSISRLQLYLTCCPG